MPHQPRSSGRLYDQDHGQANARIVERYVIVMTNVTHELIVIQADNNLDSHEQTDMGTIVDGNDSLIEHFYAYKRYRIIDTYAYVYLPENFSYRNRTPKDNNTYISHNIYMYDVKMSRQTY